MLAGSCETAATLTYTYQIADYVVKGNTAHALAGNGPIMVSKLTGIVEVAGTAFPVEYYIRRFEAKNATSASVESSLLTSSR